MIFLQIQGCIMEEFINTDELGQLAELIILKFGFENKINHSAKFNLMFTRIGYFVSPKDLILEMEKERLVTHEGYSPNANGVLINISDTEKGRQKYSELLKTINIPDHLNKEAYELLKKILV